MSAMVSCSIKVVSYKSANKAASDDLMKRWLMKCGLIIEKDAKASMKTGGRRGNRGVPSPPGMPPNVQKGILRASIRATWDKSRKAVYVGPGAAGWYGGIHEKGGNFGGRHFPARPFMVPAFEKNRAKFKEAARNLGLRGGATGELIRIGEAKR